MLARAFRPATLRRHVLLAACIVLASASTAAAQVPCSGNAGGLNERRYSVSPLDFSAGAAQVTAISFDAGGVVMTQQVQVIVDLLQESHFVALCLHSDYLASGSPRAIANGDLEYRRVSPDPMSDFVPVSRNTPAPVIATQAVGSLLAVYEFRVRLRWNTYVPGIYSTNLVWTAYRNRP